MERMFSDRILNTKTSFIREILKVTQNKEVISFAGGLPNPISFPIEELRESMNRVVSGEGAEAFQYSTTEGHLKLREYIAKRYRDNHGLSIQAEDILITSGSQQGLDLLGKVLINKQDKVCVEVPGYLGAIQAFSLYEPSFVGVELKEEGLKVSQLESTLKENRVKLTYLIPNFQNPTGRSYSLSNRRKVCEVLNQYETYVVEDDPYGELRFVGKPLPYLASLGLKKSILLGTISKIITPGMRLGWICTRDKELMNHLITAKQATDLHTNYFCQCVIYDYLMHNDLNQHINKIIELYRKQSNAMIQAMETYVPKEVTVTKPEGGMFMWATLPEGSNSMDLFERAIKKNVAFVPGYPFYFHEEPVRTMRLNYTNCSEEMITEGIRRLASVM